MKWKSDTRVLIQGINQPLAQLYVPRMKALNTNILAGISVGDEGKQLEEIPIFDLVETAIEQVGKIDITLIFVEAYQVLDAALEAMVAEIPQMIIISPGVPPLDMIELLKKAQKTNTFVLGSGSQGVILPGTLWLGISEPECYSVGNIGLVSRSDRLSDEIALSLTQAGLGQSMGVNLGTDGIIGSSFEQWLQIFEEDDNTEAIVLIGQPSGTPERLAAEYIASAIEKPVIAYLAGVHVPIERTFGDATTIIANQLSYSIPRSSADPETLAAFKEANVDVAQRPSDIAKLLKTILKKEHQ